MKEKKNEKHKEGKHIAIGGQKIGTAPRVVLYVRTLRGDDAPLCVLSEKHQQARCKIIFEEDVELYLRCEGASAGEQAAAGKEGPRWRVQLLGDVAPHPCEECDLECCRVNGKVKDTNKSKEGTHLAADMRKHSEKHRQEEKKRQRSQQLLADLDGEEAPQLQRLGENHQQQLKQHHSGEQQRQRQCQQKQKSGDKAVEVSMCERGTASKTSLLPTGKQLATVPSLAAQLDGKEETSSADILRQPDAGRQQAKQRVVDTRNDMPPAKRLKAESHQQQAEAVHPAQTTQQREQLMQQQKQSKKKGPQQQKKQTIEEQKVQQEFFQQKKMQAQQQLRNKNQQQVGLQQQVQQKQKTDKIQQSQKMGEQQQKMVPHGTKGQQEQQNAIGHRGEQVSQQPQQQSELREGQRFILKCGVSCEILSLPAKKKQSTLTGPASSATGVRNGERVTVQYKGVLAAGLRKFDSGKIGFTVGKKEVITGLEAGVIGMSVGEKRRLLIPSTLAYGNRGAPPAIPPRADLIFEVTLLGRANARN